MNHRRSARCSVPLAKSVENLCRNARPSGMRALVALLGDDSGDAARTIDQLFDYDDERTRAVLSYLTLRVDPAQLKSEAAALTKYGWPKPAPGEIVLVALDGDQKTIAAQTDRDEERRHRGERRCGFSEAAQTACRATP